MLKRIIIFKNTSFLYAPRKLFSRLYLFAGQGTQEVGMLKQLLPIYSQRIQELSELINIDFKAVTTTNPHNLINKTFVSQPLIVLSHYLHYQYKQYKISKQDWLIGHSVGEYSALVLSESIQLEDALKLVQLRGELIMKYTQQSSGMLVIIAKKTDIQKIFQLINFNDLQIGCFNTQSQLVVSGTKQKTKKLYKELKQNNILCTFLPVSAAFHCKYLKPMAEQFKQTLSGISFKVPKFRIIRNYDCKLYKTKDDIIEGLTEQIYNPVQFHQSVLRVDKNIQFIEVGHKPVLARFVNQIRKQM